MARRRGWTGTPASTGSAFGPWALGLLRLASALLLMQHGAQKLLHWPVDPAAAPLAPVVLASRSGVAGVLELAGGALLAVGLFTRPVAFVLSGLMAFAYFLSHAPRGVVPLLNRGELAALYAFVFLAISALGPGALSLDGLIRGRRRDDWARR